MAVERQYTHGTQAHSAPKGLKVLQPQPNAISINALLLPPLHKEGFGLIEVRLNGTGRFFSAHASSGGHLDACARSRLFARGLGNAPTTTRACKSLRCSCFRNFSSFALRRHRRAGCEGFG